MRRIGVMPHALCLGVRLDQCDLFLAATGQAQIVDRLAIDRKDAAGGPVFRCHVGDGGAIGQRQVLQAIAVELDELSDHAQRTQHLGHGQHQIGGGGALGQSAGQLEADHLRDQHRRGLSQHGRFGLDAAHAPAQHADAVDHRGVAVGAEHRVGEGQILPVDITGHHHAREILQIDLVDDARAGWNHLEILERLLTPAQEAITLHVALELDLAVEVQRIGAAEHVNLDRVIDDQLGRDQRIDLTGVAPEFADCIAHRGQVHHARHASEVLQHDACRHEGDFRVRLLVRIPVGHRFDVFRQHAHSVFVPEQVFQENFQRVGQLAQVIALAECGQAEVGVLLAMDLKLPAGGEGVMHGEGLREVDRTATGGPAANVNNGDDYEHGRIRAVCRAGTHRAGCACGLIRKDFFRISRDRPRCRAGGLEAKYAVVLHPFRPGVMAGDAGAPFPLAARVTVDLTVGAGRGAVFCSIQTGFFMLSSYRQHVAERAALGIPPLPLTAQQTADVIELIKAPPAGEENFLLDLITHRVPAGVDDAAKVKASYLAAVAFGSEQTALISRERATELLGTMLGGYNILPLVQLLDDAQVGGIAAEALKKTLLMFDAFHDVKDKADKGNAHARAVLQSWADAEWFTSRPEVPQSLTVTVFKVPGETNTDDLSPAPDATTRPDIPMHALAMLKNKREVAAFVPEEDGKRGPIAFIQALAEKGHPVAYVGDVVGTGSSRKSATNSVLWWTGEDIP